MRRGISSREYTVPGSGRSARGYILLTLLLFMSLLAIAAVAALPEIAQQIQRDREEELVHRGTAYMRAIKAYYKKFGRYPVRVEDLENTNQIRFLRKRYKDPMVRDPKHPGELDFKFIRPGDPVLNMLGLGGANLGQGMAPGAGPGGMMGPGQALIQNGKAVIGGAGGVGGVGGVVAPPAPAPSDGDGQGGTPGQPTPGAQNAGGDATSDSSDPKPVGTGEVFGGGPLLGVASVSKAKTIREFNKKNHYNEWVFVYDPNSDRGGLLKGPLQPDTQSRGLGMNGMSQIQAGQSLIKGGQAPTQGAPPTGQEPPDE